MGPTPLLLGVCIVVAMVTRLTNQVQAHRPKQIHSPRATQPSPSLLANWRHLYRGMDINHDGILDTKDHAAGREQYIFLAGEIGELHDALLEKFDVGWTDYLLRGITGPITQGQYLAHLTRLYLLDKAAFEANFKDFVKLINEALDFNSDGYKDWNEFRIDTMIFRWSKMAQDYSSFLAFEPVELVPLSKFEDAWLELGCDATGNGKTIVQDTFMKDGYE